MNVRWHVGPGVRANLITYGAPNLSGKRQVVQLFPQGARKGTIDGSAVRSLVIRAVYGTRVVLCASKTDAWELAAWRCIRVLEGSSLRSAEKHGLAGVRVPDLAWHDGHGAKRTDPEVQATFPAVETLADGTGWTFGRPGRLAGRVAMIRVEREDATGRVLTPAERVAMAILDTVAVDAPEQLPRLLDTALQQVERELDGPDVAERLEALAGRYRP
jgi:hypothetical protein